eukprot:15145335-Ditylum_brightwellii.AAC.1
MVVPHCMALGNTSCLLQPALYQISMHPSSVLSLYPDPAVCLTVVVHVLGESEDMHERRSDPVLPVLSNCPVVIARQRDGSK